MTSDLPKTSFYMDETLKKKLKWLADYEIRKLSGQIRYILKEYVDEWEKEHGPIPIEDDE